MIESSTKFKAKILPHRFKNKQGSKIQHFKVIGFLFFAILASASTCEQQDFVPLEPSLEVSRDQDTPQIIDVAKTFRHDHLARHSFDFQLSNPSSNTVEVVVWAQSGVREEDGTDRTIAVKQRTYQLAPGQVLEDRFSDLDLKAGTTLDVQLQCCDASHCKVGEVACPDPEGATCEEQHPLACLSGCLDTTRVFYDLECARSCLEVYDRCCGAWDPSSANLPCCLEPCSDQRCIAGQMSCPAATVCEVYPVTCLTGCIEDEVVSAGASRLDARCAISCMSSFLNCCEGVEAIIPEQLSIELPCCFEDSSCAEERCPLEGFECASNDACNNPTICFEACTDGAATNSHCLGACVEKYMECCHPERTILFPSAEVPCCFEECVFGPGTLCPASGVDCQNSNFACETVPETCASTCGNNTDCARACISSYAECCGDRLPRSSNVDVPCCFNLACEVKMEGILKLSPIECFESSECGSGQVCNDRKLCESRVQEAQQSCQISTLRSAPPSPWLWLFGGVFFYCIRRKRLHLPSKIGVLILLGGSFLAPSAAEAAEPPGFQRPRSHLSAGFVIGDFVGGEVGPQAGLGIGLTLQEALQWGYLGLGARLTFTFHTSSPQSLPFDRGFDSYHLALGPRLYWPLSETLQLALQSEYLYQGIASNTLIFSTQGRSILHGIGGWGALQARIGKSLVIEASLQSTYFPEISTTLLLAGAQFGLSGRF